MDSNGIIAALDDEIARLKQVRDLLAGAEPVATVRAKSLSAPRKSKLVKRTLSPEARKRIADAQKKRWAAAKISKSGTSVASANSKKSGSARIKTAETKSAAKKSTLTMQSQQ